MIFFLVVTSYCLKNTVFHRISKNSLWKTWENRISSKRKENVIAIPTIRRNCSILENVFPAFLVFFTVSTWKGKDLYLHMCVLSIEGTSAFLG